MLVCMSWLESESVTWKYCCNDCEWLCVFNLFSSFFKTTGFVLKTSQMCSVVTNIEIIPWILKPCQLLFLSGCCQQHNTENSTTFLWRWHNTWAHTLILVAEEDHHHIMTKTSMPWCYLRPLWTATTTCCLRLQRVLPDWPPLAVTCSIGSAQGRWRTTAWDTGFRHRRARAGQDTCPILRSLGWLLPLLTMPGMSGCSWKSVLL
jgi:hypothetical protein